MSYRLRFRILPVCGSRGKHAAAKAKKSSMPMPLKPHSQVMEASGFLQGKPTTMHLAPDRLFQKTVTIRNPPFSYLHLTLLAPATTVFDLLTARAHLTSALNQFLGITGTAVSVDFLKIEGRDVWVRVPREDGAAVVSAISGWVGGEGVAWQIRAKGDWLGAVVAGGGRRIFEED